MTHDRAFAFATAVCLDAFGISVFFGEPDPGQWLVYAIIYFAAFLAASTPTT